MSNKFKFILCFILLNSITNLFSQNRVLRLDSLSTELKKSRGHNKKLIKIKRTYFDFIESMSDSLIFYRQNDNEPIGDTSLKLGYYDDIVLKKDSLILFIEGSDFYEVITENIHKITLFNSKTNEILYVLHFNDGNLIGLSSILKDKFNVVGATEYFYLFYFSKQRYSIDDLNVYDLFNIAFFEKLIQEKSCSDNTYVKHASHDEFFEKYVYR